MTNLSTQLGGGVDIIVPTRSSPLPDTSPEPAAALASSKSEKLTTNIFPDIELHVTRLILIPLSLNKIESEELVVDDVEKSFDNNEVSYENLGETIAVTKLGELFNNIHLCCRIQMTIFDGKYYKNEEEKKESKWEGIFFPT